jgi:hypothetical protein
MTTEELLTTIVKESGITRMIMDIETQLMLPEDYLIQLKKMECELEEQNGSYFIAEQNFWRAEEDENVTDEEYNKFERLYLREVDETINKMKEIGELVVELFNNYNKNEINYNTLYKINQICQNMLNDEVSEYFVFEYPNETEAIFYLDSLLII